MVLFDVTCVSKDISNYYRNMCVGRYISNNCFIGISHTFVQVYCPVIIAVVVCSKICV